MSLVPLASLSNTQLAGLATLHYVVMPTLLTDLGFPVVQRYYKNALHDPEVIGFVAQSSDGQSLLGWVFGSPHPTELTAKLRTSPVWFGAQMLRVALTRPRTLLLLLKTIASPSSENRLESGEIELTYIGVAPDARGQGLGLALMREFITAARQQGYKRVSLSVERDNEAAIRMYQKTGFEITKTFREGRFERYRMSVVLKPQGAQEDTK